MSNDVVSLPNRTLGARSVRPHRPDGSGPEQMPAQCTSKSDEDDQPVPEQPVRSPQSLQAEASYRDWSEAPAAERPLARARNRHAAALEATMKLHGVSKGRLALMVGLAERQIGKYLDGSKPIPTAIEDALPADMAADFIRLRSATAVSAATAFRSALDALDRDPPSREVIDEGFRRLGALSARGSK